MPDEGEAFSEQLAVFEGPPKQLIIGSGKTELMKFKALELEMKACKTDQKILYIVANWSPGYPIRNSLLFHHNIIKKFFKKSTLVEVIIEEESAVHMEHTVADLENGW